MKSHITEGFRKLLAALPGDVRRQARSAYRQFLENPRHPGLGFKQIHGSDRLVSVRIGRGWYSRSQLRRRIRREAFSLQLSAKAGFS